MKRLYCMMTIVFLFLSTPFAVAGEFKLYPGAVLDQRATDDADELAKQANIPGKTKVFTTRDAFDKVVSFYKCIGREYVMPGTSGKGPQMTFILFDDGNDIATSKLWAKIQRPALGLYKEDMKNMKSRDITVIILVQK